MSDSQDAPETVLCATPAGPGCNGRVLLVEDDDDQAELVRRAFEDDTLGMELVIAPDLQQARKLLATTAPDLVITDVKLPRGSGLDLLQDRHIPAVPKIGRAHV